MSRALPTVLPGIRPEIDLILCCARTHISPQIAQRIVSLLQENIDWESLVRVAIDYGVTPLLYRSLYTTCPAAVPHPILTKLRLHFQTDALRTRSLANELLTILKLLDSEGIPVFPYKGPVLGASVYGDLVLRPCNDLDILVSKEDVLQAKDLLLSRGYRLLEKFDASKETDYLQREHHFHLERDAGAGVVELHWAIASRDFSFAVDFEQLLKHQKPFNLDGYTMATLSPEDSLLLLCVHGSKHAWNRFLWICDVSELIRSCPQWDWERVLRQADSMNCRRMVALGLFLAKDLLEAQVPDKILQVLEIDPVAQSLCNRISHRLFLEQSIPAKALDEFLLRLRAMSRLRDRLRHASYFAHDRIKPNASDRKVLKLPAFLSFFYYLIRPVRLVREYGLDLWKSFLNRPKQESGKRLSFEAARESYTPQNQPNVK